MKLNKVINLQNKEAMTKTITFNELRRLKDSLPDGSTHRIADELGISVETVRNYFGGHNCSLMGTPMYISVRAKAPSNFRSAGVVFRMSKRRII